MHSTTTEKVGQTVVVTVQYEALDARTATEFRRELNILLDDASDVLLDFGRVEFVDSAGLGAIVASLKRLRGSGGDMRICDIKKPVRALFELVRMHKLVDIYDNRDDALATCAR